MGGVTAPQPLPVQPPAGTDNTASTATAAPPPIKAGISATPAAAGPAAAAVPPAAPLPLPASNEPPVPLSNFLDFHADVAAIVGEGSRPVNPDASTRLNQSGHFSEQAGTGRVDLHLGDTDVFAGAGLKSVEVSLPGASSVTARAEVGVGHPVGPLNLGIKATAYGNYGLHVNHDDPEGHPPNYKYAEADFVVDGKVKLPHEVKGRFHAEIGRRIGEEGVNRYNPVVQVSAEKQVGPVTLQAQAAVTRAVWTDHSPKGLPQPRKDDLASGGVSASVPIDDHFKFVAGVRARGRESNNNVHGADGTNSKNYGDVEGFVGIQVSLDGSSKPKPKR
jgi:hypothetical protein